VDEMIDAKTRKGVRELYLADLRYRLGVFAGAFHCDVNAITPDDVQQFFDGLKLSPRSHNNFLRAADLLQVCAETRLAVQRSRSALARGKAQRETDAG
jgi:hypothetical protein